MRGVGSKLGVANMVGVSAYVRDQELEIPSLDYPEIPEDLKYSGRTWTQDILLVAKPGFASTTPISSSSDLVSTTLTSSSLLVLASKELTSSSFISNSDLASVINCVSLCSALSRTAQ